MKLTLSTLILLFIFHTADAQFQISGSVKDNDTKLPLVAASITINETTGTSSNEDGYYSISVKDRLCDISISYVGYKDINLQLKLNGDTTLNFFLNNLSLEEIIISDNRPAIQEIGEVHMSIERIKLTPTLLGEVDPLKSIALEPGISGGIEGTSSIHVRGGSADQNLFLLDGSRVYNQGHLLGILSVFNPSTIGSINVIKGGFSSKYGGRLSSVINVNTKRINEDETKAELSIGTISSHFYWRKKLNKKLYLMAAGRLGNLGLYTLPLQLLNSSQTRSSSIGYWMYDTNIKLHYQINEHSNLILSSYHGRDNFFSRKRVGLRSMILSKETLGFNWGNHVTSLQYNRFKNNNATKIQLSRSKYDLAFEFEDVGFDEITLSNFTELLLQSRSQIQDLSLNIEQIFHGDKWLHTIGGEGIYHFFEPSNISLERIEEPFLLPAQNSKYQTLETAIFYQGDLQLNKQISLTGGLRLSFNQGIDNVTFYNVEPRLSIAYQTNNQSAFKLSYSKMTQPMHLLSTSGSGLPNDVWIPISEGFQPQIAHQIDLGYHTELSKKNIELGAEVFYKRMNNLVDYQNGTPILFFVTQRWDLLLANNGVGYAYGAELSTSKEVGQLKTWLSYTLLWSYRQFENINNGNWYPHRFDRRHDISWTTTYELSPKWNIATNLVFATGVPYTIYDTFIMDVEGNISAVATEKHGERLPSYHRLDIVLNYKKEKPKKDRLVNWSFGVYNTYAQQNIFSVESLIELNDYDDENISFDYVLRGLAFLRAIPFVTYSIRF